MAIVSTSIGKESLLSRHFRARFPDVKKVTLGGEKLNTLIITFNDDCSIRLTSGLGFLEIQEIENAVSQLREQHDTECIS